MTFIFITQIKWRKSLNEHLTVHLKVRVSVDGTECKIRDRANVV